MDQELKLLRKKVRSGADFALTQPIFDAEAAVAFFHEYESRYGEPILPIIAGVKPLYNSRNAEFLHNEVPGMSVPAMQRERMRQSADPQQEGVEIARELIQALRPHVNGFYLMPAFNRFDLAADVLDVLRA
jgi:homocysteine S-methyltransferase